MRFFSLTAIAALIPGFVTGELLQARLLSKEEVVAVSDRSANLGHYGQPPTGCTADEMVLQIQGVPGVICAPKCADFLPCPTDVPDGVTATPQCALQDQAGHKYCILICNPEKSSINFLRAGDGQCGDATCQPVQGTGVCTYALKK